MRIRGSYFKTFEENSFFSRLLSTSHFSIVPIKRTPPGVFTVTFEKLSQSARHTLNMRGKTKEIEREYDSENMIYESDILSHLQCRVPDHDGDHEDLKR